MDLAYLRTRPETIDRLIEHQRIRSGRVPGGSICIAERWTLDDGTDLFAKSRPNAPADFFTSEAHGLRWLTEAKAVPIPEVIAATPNYLVLPWIAPGQPSAAAAQLFGAQLAALHAASVPQFGAADSGYIGSLPLDNQPYPTWPEFFAERRIRPYLRMAYDAKALTAEQTQVVDRVLARIETLAGPAEPPARIHGDLWSGNMHYGADGRVWLIDPAAHGGHRETDLATLAIFHTPYLNEIITGYQAVSPLAEGWAARVPLHQLHLLLVHVVLFAGGYVGQMLDTAKKLL